MDIMNNTVDSTNTFIWSSILFFILNLGDQNSVDDHESANQL